MTTYFASQAGAGLLDGTSPANAWAVASITWGVVDNDPLNELYLLDAISSKISIGAITGCIIRGDYPGQECTMDVADAENSCIEKANITFTENAPLIIKNLRVQGSDDSVSSYGDIFIYNCAYVIIDNVIGDGTTTDRAGIMINRCVNTTVQNCNFSNYPGWGIDILPSGGSGLTSTNLFIDNNICNNNNKGIQLRSVSANSSYITISNNTCNNNGEYGIGAYVASGYFCNHITIDNNTCDANGGAFFGTGIEISAVNGGSPMHNIIVSNNTVSNTIETGTGGIEGVGIRFDDWTYDSIMYGNTCTGDITGFVIKHINNYSFGNVAKNCIRTGFRYGANVGDVGLSGFTYNNTAIDCYIGYDCLNPAADNGTVKNNIFKNCTYGMIINDGSTTTEDYNIFDGCTNNYHSTASFDWDDLGTTTPITIGSNSSNASADINANGIPEGGSIAYHAGITEVFNMKDNKGHKFNVPPTIGAYEFTSGSVAVDREEA